MKAKVIIENGETTIVLTPETVFERDVIEKMYCKKEKHELHTRANADYKFGLHTDHNIEIRIKEIV